MSDSEHYSSSDEENPNDYYNDNYLDEFDEEQEMAKEQYAIDQEIIKLNQLHLNQHDIDNLTDKIIQNAHKLGLSKEDAFINVCSKMSMFGIPSKEDVNQWFNGWSEIGLDSKYLTLIEKINDYYFSKLNPFIAKSRFNGPTKFFPGAPRYEIGIGFDSPGELTLFDHFHGQKKQFKFAEITRLISDTFLFHPIDSHHILFYDFKMVSLIELDYEKEEYWFLWQEYCGKVVKILLDNSDVSKFVLFNTKIVNLNAFNSVGERIARYGFKFGRISSDGLELNDHGKMLTLTYGFSCPKFSGNILTVLEKNFINGRQELYCSDLVEGKFVRQFSFNGAQNIKLRNFTANDSTPFAWLENECFVLAKNKKYQHCLYSFDTLIQICKTIHLNFPFASNLHFDLDGNLATKESDKITFYAVKKPQKLDQIIWCEIQHQSTQGNKNLYEKAMKHLPNNLKPFGVKNYLI